MLLLANQSPPESYERVLQLATLATKISQLLFVAEIVPILAPFAVGSVLRSVGVADAQPQPFGTVVAPLDFAARNLC